MLKHSENMGGHIGVYSLIDITIVVRTSLTKQQTLDCDVNYNLIICHSEDDRKDGHERKRKYASHSAIISISNIMRPAF